MKDKTNIVGLMLSMQQASADDKSKIEQIS